MGQTVLVHTSKVNNKWKKEVERSNPPHILCQSIGTALTHVTVKGKDRPNTKATVTARGEQLAQQLKLKENEILVDHPQVKERVFSLIRYEEVAVGQTERHIKPALEINLQAQNDSWLHVKSPWASPVAKMDSSTHLAVDYCELNKFSISTHSPGLIWPRLLKA